MQKVEVKLNDVVNHVSPNELDCGEIGIIVATAKEDGIGKVGDVIIRGWHELIFPGKRDYGENFAIYQVRRLRPGETVTFKNE